MSTMDNSANSSDTSFVNPEISLPRSVRFWLILLFNIPSTICSLVLIAYIIINRTQRYALHTHTILVILIFGLPIQLLDFNFHLVFLQHGSIEPQKPFICLLWWLTDNGFCIGGLILISWLAIERHILIFHDRWVSNSRGRFLFHYLPLIILVTYILLFYFIVIFFLPCENTYLYTEPLCGDSPCYQSYSILALWEFIFNTGAPILLEGIVSTALVIRVQWQKQRLHQSAQWRKQRRMIIQLLLISGVNISLNFPYYLLTLAHLYGLPAEDGGQAELYFSFFGYFIIFLFPFVSLCQFPELHKKIKNKIFGTAPRQPYRTATAVRTNRASGVTRRNQVGLSPTTQQSSSRRIPFRAPSPSRISAAELHHRPVTVKILVTPLSRAIPMVRVA